MTDINVFAYRIMKLRIAKGFKTDWSNVAEKTMLVITELGRAVDADRKSNRKLVEHEMNDALVRLLDLMWSLGFPIDDDLEKNLKAWEKRIYKHGKKY